MKEIVLFFGAIGRVTGRIPKGENYITTQTMSVFVGEESFGYGFDSRRRSETDLQMRKAVVAFFEPLKREKEEFDFEQFVETVCFLIEGGTNPNDPEFRVLTAYMPHQTSPLFSEKTTPNAECNVCYIFITDTLDNPWWQRFTRI
ncbi:hypothetical protein A2223_00225 [Candidatus Falkowbacteria bacterium RIFOXYA2_FULL_35_8]|uniref:Uncharacterized protein n=1 Tax=Candidatus Falkowbacteria bacterium RIFOXYC2_FULL_36_12 TaxID=1798002 RepID=A0A1F5SZ87_9BACT|nr:MAG: hypothetical protein A2300_01585 [Candidatus Falkowbacteria bacterium RIFOXYB2_FULL_35_7]OGF31806.1 MAG: hypothetical protein A2478_04965 [Candidatus Falkowbacteria bacterium RIFOXYC2_FULL_36_12]OGF33784.1 MAG: hypothetical protein A2223_00225 [Candidatus Falkowbacteria bacterium RIFOXYA2_FULL_35_8]